MSSFETALRHYAAAAHGIEKLNCLRSALLTHQAISTAAMGKPDSGLNEQIEAIDGFLHLGLIPQHPETATSQSDTFDYSLADIH